MRKIIPVLILVVAVSIICVFLVANSTYGENSATISRVIDGDTVVLGTGEHVRLLGINTPEKGAYFYNESTEYLKSLVGKKSVVLEADVEDKDKYGRLLRNIYIGNVFVNLELVKNGYAFVYIIPPNGKHSEQFIAAEDEAKSQGLGVWRNSIKDAFCLGIYEFRYNAAGNDNENLNGEYIIFRNSCNYTLDMTGWVVKDSSNSQYKFSNFSVKGKDMFVLHTGAGKNNETDIFWGVKKPVWNNGGDRLLMQKAGGEIVLDYSY